MVLGDSSILAKKLNLLGDNFSVLLLIFVCLFLVCKPLKRKTGVAEPEVEPADNNAGPGNVNAPKGPFQTPPPTKSGKQKVSRTKANRAGSLAPMPNVGEWEFDQILSY